MIKKHIISIYVVLFGLLVSGLTLYGLTHNNFRVLFVLGWAICLGNIACSIKQNNDDTMRGIIGSLGVAIFAAPLAPLLVGMFLIAGGIIAMWLDIEVQELFKDG